MSAWVVDKAHIDVLLDCAHQHGRQHGWTFTWYVEDPAAQFGYRKRELVPGQESEVGAMLLAENVRSVAHRYPQDGLANLPGPIPTPKPDEYRYRPTGRTFSHGEALKAIGCFEYQSCETDDWRQSEAHAFCEALKDTIIGAMYPDDSPWGYSDADLGRTINA